MNHSGVPQNDHPSPAQTLPTSTLAIVSLIAGILSYIFLPVVGTVVALITGYMARAETRSVPPKATGDGLAVAGIVMGWIQVGLIITIFLCLGALMVLGINLDSVPINSEPGVPPF